MSFTTTPNYGLYKPTINADNDQWGNHLNTNADVLDSKAAPLNSPALTGSPTAPTVTPITDNSTKLATTAFVQNALSVVPAGALVSPTVPTANPGTLWWDSTGGQLYLRYDDGNSQQWVTTSNVEGLANAATKTDVASTLNNVGRNLIHNSMFNIAQRSAGPFTAGGYTLDRWQVVRSGSTFSETQLTLTDADRTAIGDEVAKYALQCVITGTAGAGDVLIPAGQVFEDVRRTAGKTVILSFWAMATAGTPKLGISFIQSFGSGGSPSANVSGIGAQSVTLSTVWTRYAVTIAMPSIIGKTFGTTIGSDALYMYLCGSSGTTGNAGYGSPGVQSYTLQLWGVQLEITQPGQTQPTPLEKPDPELQLRQCQRFYAIGAVVATGYTTAGSGFGVPFSLPVTMRATPSLVANNLGCANITTPSLSTINVRDGYSTGTATATGPVTFYMSYTASADL